MATFPLFPEPVEEDDYDTSDDDADLLMPDFDINSDDSDNDDDEDDEDSEEINELTSIMGIRKGPVLFPQSGVSASQMRIPFVPPIPKNAPKFSAPAPIPTPIPTPGLRFNIMKPQVPQPSAPTTGKILPTASQLRAPVLPIQAQVRAPVLPSQGQVKAPVLPSQGQVKAPVVPSQGQVKATGGEQKMNINEILSKMQGITISTGSEQPSVVPININDILIKETDETVEDFEARKILTHQLASIPDYKLNTYAAVTAGLIMMKKSKLGVSYTPDVEAAIGYLIELLKR